MDRAADGDDLLLSFGDVRRRRVRAASHVGRRIRAALEADGFTVRWDGTLGMSGSPSLDLELATAAVTDA